VSAAGHAAALTRRLRACSSPSSATRAGHLSRDAKLALLEDLVARGGGEWLDAKTRRTCLVLWRTAAEWAQVVYSWAVGAGLKDSVVTLDELQQGEEVRGTELAGLHREVLVRAIKALEGQGRAK
jgi:ESCRT-II complex subunit VPS25